MKSLTATVILLLCVLTLAFLNTHFVGTTVEETVKRLNALPDIGEEGCVEHAYSLGAFWEEKAPFLEASIPFPLVDRVRENAVLLATCASVGDVYGFHSAHTLLLDALEDLLRLEKFSFSNLI